MIGYCCICGGKNCWEKWTPRDDVSRRIEVTGCTLTITQHPMSVAEGLAMPVDGLPTGTRSIPYNGTGPNCYGIDVDNYYLTMGLEYGNQQLHAHAIDDRPVDTPIDLTVPPFDLTDGLNFQKDTIDLSKGSHCTGGSVAPTISWNKVTEYGDDYIHEPAAFEDVPVTLRHSKILAFDRRIYIRCSSIGRLAPFEIGDPPNNEADRVSGGWDLEDDGVWCYYNSRIGYAPTSILTPLATDYGTNGDGYAVYSLFGDLHYRDSIYPGFAGTTSTGLTLKRRVQEDTNINPGATFTNGVVTSTAGITARLSASTTEAWVQSATFGTPTPGAAKYPHRDCPPIGIPNRLATYSGGFANRVIIFDADWSGDLTQFVTADIYNSVYCTFLMDLDIGTPGYTRPANGTVETIARGEYPFTAGKLAGYATSGIGGSWVDPLFDGTADVSVKLSNSFIVSGSPNRPPQINGFNNVQSYRFNGYYSSDGDEECLKKWRRKAEFCCNMPSTGEQGGTTYSSPKFSLVDGAVVAGATGSPPELQAIGTATDAKFCRVEY